MALELMLPGSTSGFRRSSSSRSCWLSRAISSDEKSHRLCKCSLVTRSRRLCKCSLATRSRRRSLFVVNSLAEHRWYRRWVAHDVENSLARAATLRVSACGRIAFEVGFSTSLCHVEEAFESLNVRLPMTVTVHWTERRPCMCLTLEREFNELLRWAVATCGIHIMPTSPRRVDEIPRDASR